MVSHGFTDTEQLKNTCLLELMFWGGIVKKIDEADKKAMKKGQ